MFPVIALYVHNTLLYAPLAMSYFELENIQIYFYFCRQEEIIEYLEIVYIPNIKISLCQ